MKPGDLVQIRQKDFLHDALRTYADPPIHGPGPIELWIYARVQETLEDGRVRVLVEHPGNRDHGSEKFVHPEEIRTKADVEKLAASQLHANPQWNAKLQEHHRIQSDRLT